MFQKLVEFLKDVRAEIGKITWPTREELRGSTVIVIVTVLLLTFFVAVVDQIFNLGLQAFISVL